MTYFSYDLRAFLKAQRRAVAGLVRSTRSAYEYRKRRPQLNKWGYDEQLSHLTDALGSARLYARAVQMLGMLRRGYPRDLPFTRVERFRYRPTRLSDFQARMICPDLARDAYSHYHARYLAQEKAIHLAKALITSNPGLARNHERALGGYFDHPELPDGIAETVRRFENRACGCPEHDIRPLGTPRLRRVKARRKQVEQ